jgi:hypothetical protein
VVLACDVVQFLERIVGQLKASASNIETRSLPTLTRSYPRRFTFYVADPASSIVSRSLPLGSTASLAVRQLPDRSSHSLH